MDNIGAPVYPHKPVLKPRPVPKTEEVLGYLPYTYGHIARDPNTCYNRKYMEYMQKIKTDDEIIVQADIKKLEVEKIYTKYSKHTEHKRYQRILNEKINNKLKEYDVKIEERRKRLTDLLCKEEKEFLVEIVSEAAKGKERKIQGKIQEMNNIRDQHEAERLAVVKEKRRQQYLSRCDEFRPIVANQRLRESKAAQLIQMKEKESKRNSEKEIDYFWREMNLKYCEQWDKREEAERLRIAKEKNEFKFYSDLQAKQKRGKEEIMRQEILKEREHFDKLRKQMEEDDKAYKELKDKKRVEVQQSFNKQLKEREEVLQRTRDKELKIQRAYDKLADEEIAKEQAAIRAKVSTGYNDMILYQKFLAEIKLQKEEEDRKMGKIVEETMKKAQNAEDDTKCKVIAAKQALQEAVLKERAQQLEERRKREEEFQKRLKVENELTNASQKHNARLRLEYERQNILKVKQYRDDLQQQIAYNKILKQRETDNMQNILDAAVIENQKYDNIVAEVLSGNIKTSETHCFRQTIIDQECQCPKPNY